MPELLQALLVDIEDDDPVVDAARHRQHEARVVDDVVELVDEPEVVAVRGVPEEEEADREPERDPDDMLFHSAAAVSP